MNAVVHNAVNDYVAPVVSNGKSGNASPLGLAIPFIVNGAMVANVFLIANTNAGVNAIVIGNAVGLVNGALNVNAVASESYVAITS